MRDLVLYGVDLLLSEGAERNIAYSRLDLAGGLDLSRRTLNNYLTDLASNDLIRRANKRFVDDLNSIMDLTRVGMGHLFGIRERIDGFLLVPERHLISRPIKLKFIMDNIMDPLEKLFLLSLYNRNREFNLPVLLSTMGTTRQDCTVFNTISSIHMSDGDNGSISFIDTFSKSSFHGLRGNYLKPLRKGDQKGINASLILAEALQKNGDLQGSMNIYNNLMDPSSSINDDQWFIARMGLARTVRKMGDTEKALRILDDTAEQVERSVYQAYINQLKALVLSMIKDHEGSMKLYNSAIGSLHVHGYPLLLSIAYNNRGTLYFRMDDFENAESDWKRSRKYARKAGSDYCLCAIFMNLSHIMSRKGEFSRARELISKAKEISTTIGDLEMLSGSVYNESLMLLYMGKADEAVTAYNHSTEIAYPLPSPIEKMERRSIFQSIADEMGIDIDADTLVLNP